MIRKRSFVKKRCIVEHLKKFADILSEEEKLFLLKRLYNGETEANSKVCATCGSKIERFSSLSLEFGDNIRMRASFCATDCLGHFLRSKLEKNI